MAEAFGVAASVATFVEIAFKVTSLCLDYGKKVKHAEGDIKRLQAKIEGLAQLAEDVQQQIKSDKALSTSKKLEKAVLECYSQIESVQKKLEASSSTGRKFMSKFGVRSLKWPFESKDVDKIVLDLERCNANISLALQLDNTRVVLDIRKEIDLKKIPSAASATFDAYSGDQHDLDARCHPDTRQELLEQIKSWAKDPQGKTIFWLNGVAGTGKSTISRTIAQFFFGEGSLGASFFFKRGENERQNTSRFFTTITTQLLRKIPDMISHVREAIDEEPEIAAKTLEKQFDKLIFQPLTNLQLGQDSGGFVLPLVLVIDALDECDGDRDIKTVLHLLAKVQDLTTVQIRVFLTSRPDLPIRLGFHNMTTGTHESMVLQDIPAPTIEHDISVFVKDAFSRIRQEFNRESLDQIPEDWPGEENIKRLAKMAVPLFIFAATICRFVGDTTDWNPERRLATILENNREAPQLEQTYLPVMRQFEAQQPGPHFQKFGAEFRKIIGSIVLLANPLSTGSLASLLDIPKADVDAKLRRLHSVLSVPSDPKLPVRLLHLSFREFLVGDKDTEKSWFRVDEKETNSLLTTKCLQLLSASLKENMCSMEYPGKRRTELDLEKIEKAFPAHIRYACLHWVHHLMNSSKLIHDNDEVDNFLRGYLLYWLEALSLLGRLSDSIRFIDDLCFATDEHEGSGALAFLCDAKRFILQNRWIVDQAPLQLYSSALIFSPQKSIIRKVFQGHIPRWIRRLPKTPESWGAELQKLEGSDYFSNVLAFLPDGRLVSRREGKLCVWNTETGEQTKSFEGKFRYDAAIAVSPDGFIAREMPGGEIILFELETGEQIGRFEGHRGKVRGIAFDHGRRLLASASDDGTVKVWDAVTGSMLKLFENDNRVLAVAFSLRGKLAWGLVGGEISIWDIKTEDGVLSKAGPVAIKTGMSAGIRSLVFVSDTQLALLSEGLYGGGVEIWDLVGGQKVQEIDAEGKVYSMCLLPARQIALGLRGGEIDIFNLEKGQLVKRLRGNQDAVTAVVFSSVNMRLASVSWGEMVRLWDLTTSAQAENSSYERDYPIAGFRDQGLPGLGAGQDQGIPSSPDNRYLAVRFWEAPGTRIWDTSTAEEVARIDFHCYGFPAFSFDGKQIGLMGGVNLVEVGRGTVAIWSMETKSLDISSIRHPDAAAIAFSPDNTKFASASGNLVIVWDFATKSQTNRFQYFSEEISGSSTALSFSPDNRYLSLLSQARGRPCILLWDTKIETESSPSIYRTFLGDDKMYFGGVAFLPGGLLATFVGGYGKRTYAIWVWDIATGNQVRTFGIPTPVRNLRYNAEIGCLESDRGVLESFPSDDAKGKAELNAKYIFLRGDWVTQGVGGHDLLWLPPDYRSLYSFARGNCLTIITQYGALDRYEFAFP
ncbi:hypothetical protein TWF481_004098 [Arthrobotrys musiformis]|uniref:Nephrocystin 3-like N-terminal domain-containing protein n=1 Tax=Arthrobotrys musiformis TaxID=47236 RepID=A0AAV9WJM3_9PEZI